MANNRVPLPSGGWAEFREPKQVTEGHRRPVRRALGKVSVETREAVEKIREDYAKSLPDGQEPDPEDPQLKSLLDKFQPPSEDLDAYTEANDQAIVAMVSAWSYAEPITLDSVLNALKAEDYDYLQQYCARYTQSMFTNFQPLDLQTVNDPNSPFGGSGGSTTSSPEAESYPMDSPKRSIETGVS